MNSPLFRTIAPIIVGTMLVFSIYVLLRGHNQPGGGFIGGLIASAAIAVYFLAEGLNIARWRLRVSPSAIAGCGVVVAAASGLISALFGMPFLTGLWGKFALPDGTDLYLSTPLMFDIGVFLAVVGAITEVVFVLASDHD